MKTSHQSGQDARQAGSALLIAIFALLLISVVGIALLVSTGADSSLAGNYRTSTAAYYAAAAGLEEARGRLLWRNQSYIGDALSSYLTADVHNVLYIINAAGAETVNPLDTTSSYADKEYDTEFLPNWGLASGANVYTPYVTSVSIPGSPTIPGPLYKWVRVNAITEKAINLDVNSDGTYDQGTPLYYDGTGLNLSSSGVQALEITAFAYMPDKSTKVLQYVVASNSVQSLMAPSSVTQGFPSALTLAGNGVSYTGPDTTSFYVDGSDPTIGRSCASPAVPAVLAIGYTNPADQPNIVPGTLSNPHPGNYVGYAPPPPAPSTPSFGQVSLLPSLQKPSQLDALMQTITQNADAVIPGPANGASLSPLGMSATNPMTVVVNGNMNLNAPGFGLLVVTGTLNFDPNASWTGVVLVIGKGSVTSSSGATVNVNGAMLVAQTRDPSTGNLLADPNLGNSTVHLDDDSVGTGIYYNSCSILQALAPTSYRVLSFREITPP
jgi:hypothetical protein